MFKKQRLHPIAILLHTFNSLFQIVRHYYVVIIATIVALRDMPLFYLMLIFFGVILIASIVGILWWYRLTYEISGDELIIRYGIFIRKQRFISRHRIQSIDLTAHVIHRLLRLVKVDIKTAGSKEGTEATLSAVTLKKGEELRQRLIARQLVERDEEKQQLTKRPSVQISFKRLFIAGSTSGSIGVMLGLIIVAFFKVEQYIPRHYYDLTVNYVVGLSIIILIGFMCIVLMILWLLSIARTIIKYGHFTITKRDNELLVTRGLLEKKQLTIPLHRVQAIEIEKSIIRQPLGYARIVAVVAGGADVDDEFPVLCPIIKVSEIEKFLQTFLPAQANISQPLKALPKRARKFYIIRSLIPAIFAAIGIIYFLPQFSWLLLILLIVSLSLGMLRFYDGGYEIDNRRIIIQFRKIFSLSTVVMNRNRIQAFEMKQHKIQQRERLANLHLSIIGSAGAGTHYMLKDMCETDIQRVYQWFSYRMPSV